MKNINIHKEIGIKAEGQYNSKHCKPVVCWNVNTRELRRFTSVWDAARELGIHAGYISTRMNNGTVCKGWMFFDARDTGSYLNLIMDEYNNCMRDATEYKRIKAEEEAIRKAEEQRLEEERKARERHAAAVAKAEAKVAKYAADCAKYQAKFNEAITALDEANKELEALME